MIVTADLLRKDTSGSQMSREFEEEHTVDIAAKNAVINLLQVCQGIFIVYSDLAVLVIKEANTTSIWKAHADVYSFASDSS